MHARLSEDTFHSHAPRITTNNHKSGEMGTGRCLDAGEANPLDIRVEDIQPFDLYLISELGGRDSAHLPANLGPCTLISCKYVVTGI